MKHFSSVLNRLLNEHGLTQNEVSLLSGLKQGKISRLISDEIRADKHDLEALLSAFDESKDRFLLAVAHIQDEVPEELFRLFEITLRAQALREKQPINADILPTQAEQALRFLLDSYATLPGISDLFIDLARLIGWQPGVMATGVIKPKPPKNPGKYPPAKSE